MDYKVKVVGSTKYDVAKVIARTDWLVGIIRPDPIVKGMACPWNPGRVWHVYVERARREQFVT